VHQVADAIGAKPGQVALAWLLAQGDDIVPIPGTKRRAFLEENIAAEGIDLAVEHRRRLDKALGPGKVSGNRYPDWVMAGIDR
jgi:aryl-alcohol dehydrogenase-like predicted oxidoreductase